MRRKDFLLTAAAVAVFAVFNPAFAADNAYDASGSAGVETNDRSASASMSADASNSVRADSSTAMEESAPADELERYGETLFEEEDELTGLESTDQLAADTAQEGRDNSREQQSLIN